LNNTCVDVNKTAGHTIFFVGLALYFNADFGRRRKHAARLLDRDAVEPSPKSVDLSDG
jgi:hypothetical protein